jgi:YEATS domain-containing protein 4
VREVVASPFEVTEIGWGEFEATITIHFQDPDEAAIELQHTIKFYHPDMKEGDLQTKKPVMYEVYDEIVFTDPKPAFKQCLLMYRQPDKKVHSTMSEYYTPFDDEEDLHILSLIRDHLEQEINATKAKLTLVDSDLSTLTGCQISIPRGGAKKINSTEPGNQTQVLEYTVLCLLLCTN